MEENHRKGPTLVVGMMPNGKFQLKTMMRGYSRVMSTIWGPQVWLAEIEDQGDEQPLFFHLRPCLAGKYFSRGDYKLSGTP
jgi:hypothetical protein